MHLFKTLIDESWQMKNANKEKKAQEPIALYYFLV